VPELSRSQLAVYCAVAVALLLLGARYIRSTDSGEASSGGVAYEADSFEVGAEGARDVVVHVAGAVRNPGVYRLPAGSRVADAVERAGGATGGGSTDAVNLAARLSDGQQIVVPGRGAAAPATGEGPVSLGSATAEQLDEIEGIGPVTAQKIIEFRDQKGGLSSVEELDEVSGIGPATMEALRAALQP
jgi:competence protein ComEA